MTRNQGTVPYHQLSAEKADTDMPLAKPAIARNQNPPAKEAKQEQEKYSQLENNKTQNQDLETVAPTGGNTFVSVDENDDIESLLASYKENAGSASRELTKESLTTAELIEAETEVKIETQEIEAEEKQLSEFQQSSFKSILNTANDEIQDLISSGEYNAAYQRTVELKAEVEQFKQDFEINEDQLKELSRITREAIGLEISEVKSIDELVTEMTKIAKDRIEKYLKEEVNELIQNSDIKESLKIGVVP